MLSCKIIVPYEKLENLNRFFDTLDSCNVSIFENTEFGFLQDLDENGFPIAKFFDIEIFVSNMNQAKNLQKTLKNEFSQDLQNFQINKINSEDWVNLYLKGLEPVIVGNFYFYNESLQEPKSDSNLTPIKLNSALAFGSGHHQTTKACLLNAEFLKSNSFSPSSILDMGCGTGILGICALKLWKDANLLGIDIDPEAVEVSVDNYRANNVHANAIVSGDLTDINEKFDLIFCNILKQPLLDLAKSFYEKLNMRGYIITSGFITSQKDEIIAGYQALGFDVINVISMEDWLSILFRK